MLLNVEKEIYPAFIVRRFFRIFPAYFICVAGSLILVLYGFMPKTYEDEQYAHAYFSASAHASRRFTSRLVGRCRQCISQSSMVNYGRVAILLDNSGFLYLVT